MYLVWVNDTKYFWRDDVAEALETKRRIGGKIYEPLGMTAARESVYRRDFVALAQDLHARLHDSLYECSIEECPESLCKKAARARREDEALLAEVAALEKDKS